VRSLSDADFAAVRTYLEDEAGLVFDESRRSGLAVVVEDRLRASGFPDVPSYLAALSVDAAENQRLLDEVTIQETHFFRNTPQMAALRRRVLPDLLRRSATRDRPLTIWSAGCSTGEEPYTLAMLLLEMAPRQTLTGRVRILGTDVSQAALQAAGRATYAGRTMDAVPPVVRERWFEPRPGGAFAVKPVVTGLVELRRHNLVRDPVPFEPAQVDLVLCRNVTIYFGRETTRRLVGSFHDVLSDGGYLVIGHSETLWQVTDAFSLHPVDDAFLYRRDAAPPPQPAEPPREVTPVRRQMPPVPRRDPDRPAPPVRPATERLAAARRLVDAGDYAAAAAAAGDAVAIDGLLAPAYVVLGRSLASMGQHGAAVEPLRKAVYLDPGSGEGQFLLADALSRTGSAAAAAVAYRAAAAILRTGDLGLAPLTGGRDAEELARLCEHLAARCDGAAVGRS
jgi:chemotaxis protein methyltransferase CheR